MENVLYLVDVSDIFNFFCSGQGKGKSRATGRGGGVRFSVENPTGGGRRSRRMGGGGGREGVCSELGAGGGSKYFFPGPKRPPRLDVASRAPRDEGRSCRCRPFHVS